MRKVKLYDTTLRDGAQTEGVSFSLNDKLRIAKRLDELGIHYIEGGWPGSNPKDIEFFREVKKLKLKNARITAFGSTRRANVSANKDKNLKAILKSRVKTCTIFGKSWDLHVKDVLKVSLEENLKMIEDSIRFLKSKGLEVIFDAEHFFDGYKSNSLYAIRTLLAAEKAGADSVCLCDTNGGTLTSHLVRIIRNVKQKVGLPLGVHTHNDSDLAVANSIAAVAEGAEQVQGTINGLGERCGNANLVSIIGILCTKMNVGCISKAKLKELKDVSRYVDEVCNIKPLDNQPFVGNSAFAHKGGIHIDAMIKNPKTYEHVDPKVVGNKTRFLISELAGRSPILLKADEMALGLKKDTPQARRILRLLQNMEHKGYHYEVAEGSFELLMRRAMHKLKKFFDLEGFRVIIEKKGNKPPLSEATIKVKVRGLEEHTASEGDGPVNALDNALRKALEEFYPKLKEMHLSDFKVRIIDEKAGTAAKVRILIQSHDKNSSWWTVGVSTNIIEAAWQALVDSVEYKLLKDLGKSKNV